ncbi:MAG: CRISPR-associated endonuclease Cas1 [Eubacteriales bacterium]|nr:CRISPR-associated endonuclease Cas1 [Eubacteriales bacterium]
MAVLYVREQGASIQKSGERLIVTKNGARLLEMPLIHIENVSVVGNVQVTTQALHIMMERGIDVSYFSHSGKYLGHTAAESSKNIFLRLEQYEYYLNEEKRLSMAKVIVKNKICNQIAMLKRHRWQGSDYNWKKDVQQMEKYLSTLDAKETANEVLGIEGICSNIYFGAFGNMLKCDFSFQGRNRRPPKDPVNALISLAYTFLTKEVSNALDAESFEVYFGFLHGIRYGRKSLALDIVEEFRQPVADRMVIFLLNKRILGKYDFELPEDGSVTLNEEGFRKFCSEYEKWMNGKNAATDGNSYRTIIHSQTAKLKRAIMRGEQYEPYCMGNHVCG